MTTQDADLIRELTSLVDQYDLFYDHLLSDFLRRAAARLAELTQPAPLALSAEDASAWGNVVSFSRGAVNHTSGDRAVLAVDALLRKRVQRLTDEQIHLAADATLTRIQKDDWAATDADILEFARAVEASHFGSDHSGGEIAAAIRKEPT